VAPRTGGALAAGLLLVLGMQPAVLAPLASFTFDACQRLLPRERDDWPVTLVAIDGESLARIGQWPWPRTRLAELVSRLAAQAPAAIGLDLLLVEPDRTSPEQVAAGVEAADATLAARLRALPAHDATLAAALWQAPVVLGVGMDPDHAAAGGREPVPVDVRDDVAVHLPRAGGVLHNLPLLEQAARGVASLGAPKDAGVVRRLPVAVMAGDVAWPGLAFEMLRVAGGDGTLVLSGDAGGVRAVEVAGIRVPTDADGHVRPHFAAADPRRVVAAADVLAGNVPRDAIAGKLVLVGFTAQGTSDLVATPLGDVRPGYEVHAEAIESVLAGQVLTRPRLAPWLELLAYAWFVVFAVVVVPRASARHALPAFAAQVAAVLALTVLAFDARGWLFAAAAPLAGGTLVLLVVLALVWLESERARQVLAGQLAREREAAARLDGELAAARRIQVGMLPQASTVADPRVDVAALMLTARMVGGDLYDFFKLDADRLYVAIGDVSGKGVPASLFMAISKSIARSHAGRGDGDLDHVVAAAAAEIARDNPESLFVTLLAAVLDLRSGLLRYVNAGHETPLLHGDRGLRLLDAGGGPPLCVLDDFAYETAEAQLAAGDTLLLVTDGVTEALDARGGLYGRERLQRVLAAPHADAAALVAAVRDDVLAFAHGVDLPDDVAIVAVRYRGGA
jgi:serine phosphatase RsbU (regulator of sigma subunit)